MTREEQQPGGRVLVLPQGIHITVFFELFIELKASQVAQRLKHLPATWETWVRSLGREDPLEKEMATHSSILAWEILWAEKPGGLQSMGSQRVEHDWATKHTHMVLVLLDVMFLFNIFFHNLIL